MTVVMGFRNAVALGILNWTRASGEKLAQS